MPLTLIPVQPIGSHESPAFVDGRRPNGTAFGELRMVEIEDFPPEHVGRGRAFRDARVQLGRSLGDAARLLGISVTQLSDLERGAATLSEDDWRRALETLARGPQPKESTR